MAARDEPENNSIEFEPSDLATFDAPSAATGDAAPRPWAALSVLMIVLGTFTALLWVNSRESEPADDIADTEAESDGDSTEGAGVDPDPFMGSQDVIATMVVQTFSEVVFFGDKLIALGRTEASVPEILRSSDGAEWASLDVQFSDDGAQSWFYLYEIGGELVLKRQLLDETTWHRSSDGEVWTDLNFAREDQLDFVPISLSGDAIIGIRVERSQVIEEIVAGSTTLDIDEPLCFAGDNTGFGEQFDLIGCDRELSGTIDASVISDELDATAVLACLSAFGRSFTAVGVSYVRRDLASGEDINEVSFEPRFTTLHSQRALPSERVGFFAQGSSTVDFAPCDGIIDLGEPVGPQWDPRLVVVDVVGQQVDSFQPPVDLGPILSSTWNLLGSFDGGSGERLIAESINGLWALDLASGEWETLFEQPNAWGRGSPVVMIDDQVHVLHRDQLRTFDLVQTADGISATESSSTVVSASNGEALFVDGILAASNDLIIISSEGAKWAIDVSEGN